MATQRRLSLRTKIVAGFLCSLVLMCLFVYFYFPSIQRKSFNEAMIKDDRSTVEMIALGVSIGLESDDFSIISTVFNWAKKDPDLNLILLTDNQHEVFALFNPYDLNLDTAFILNTSGIIKVNNRFKHFIHHPIYFNGISYGNVYMCSDLEGHYQEIQQRTMTTLIIVILFFFIGLVLSIIYSINLTRPLKNLINATKDIIEGKYSIQISKTSNDEIGDLVDGFNTMTTRIQDLIEREATRMGDEKFKEVIESAHDMIWITDLKGNINFLNKSFERISGHLVEEWVNESVYGLLSENETEVLNRNLNVSSQENFAHFEIKFQNSKKNELVLSFNTVPLRRNQNLIGYVSFIRDITARKKAESELNEALSLAKESDRLKSAFLSTMSHELRTPLNAIIGFSELIFKDCEARDCIQYAKTINSSGNHLLKLVEEIFDISLIESGNIKINKEDFNLGDLLKEVNDMMIAERRVLSKTHIELECVNIHIAQRIKLHSDPHRIKQVLINLIKNAFKFTESGSIRFGISSEELSMDEDLKFFVQDTGVGIPDDKKEIIFDVFRQADDSHSRKFGGVGLGLSVSKKLIEILGGKIWLESKLDIGSSFYFTQPKDAVHVKAFDDSPINTMHADATLSKGKTILIVEDNPDSLTLLRHMLKKYEFELLEATNGKEAVDICLSNLNVGLVFLDMNMPVMNGFEAAKIIKDKRPEIRIIAQTAYAISGDKEKILKAGCDDYLSKPISPSQLNRLINSLFS